MYAPNDIINLRPVNQLHRPGQVELGDIVGFYRYEELDLGGILGFQGRCVDQKVLVCSLEVMWCKVRLGQKISSRRTHLFGEEILDAVSRCMLAQTIGGESLPYSLSHHHLQVVLGMTAELARVRMMRVHGGRTLKFVVSFPAGAPVPETVEAASCFL